MSVYDSEQMQMYKDIQNYLADHPVSDLLHIVSDAILHNEKSEKEKKEKEDSIVNRIEYFLNDIVENNEVIKIDTMLQIIKELKEGK